MHALSTPDPDAPEAAQPAVTATPTDRRRRLLDALLWIGAPAAAAVIVTAAVVVETATVDRDLQLVVAPTLEPGRRAAVRALFFVDDAEGPVFTTAPVDVTMRDANDRLLASTKLRPTDARSMDGLLAVPPGVRGMVTLEAVAHPRDGGEASVRMRVSVRPGARGLDAEGRLAFALQHLGLGPLVPEGAATPPSRLDVRVPSGVCRPEIPCELLVRIGEPLASVTITPSASVTLGPPDRRGASPSLALITVVTHGPEAETELVAVRDGAVVARRSVRLPVDLSTTIIRVTRVLLEAPARPRVSVEGTEQGRGVIVDGFRDGHWEHSTMLSPRFV